ncbi:MAG: MGDG synthase family glycosyltransferase, partial [Luteolibacter sp.]
MQAKPRILIVTAAFGEGHNSAARNLALALEMSGCTVTTADPCLLGAPRLTAWINLGYRWITTRTPWLWAKIYRSTDRCDFSKSRLSMMRLPECAMRKMIAEIQPDAVVSTYPLYPYFMPRIDSQLPIFTVVTDSIEINSAWIKSPSTAWFVSDTETRDQMIRNGLDASRVIDTGFAVHPVFSDMTTIEADDPCQPFEILYFATASTRQMKHNTIAMLAASPEVRVTLVMGKNTRGLLPTAIMLKKKHPGRLRLIGWTRRVPQLLAKHHIVVGKAGGATVHEAIAARCPMLIHHLVPGQEEGNLKLLESIGAGALADSPATLANAIADLVSNQATPWRDMKLALLR